MILFVLFLILWILATFFVLTPQTRFVIGVISLVLMLICLLVPIGPILHGPLLNPR